MAARRPSERFWVTLQPFNTFIHVRMAHSPLTDDTRISTQSAQHVTLALFDKLDLLTEGGFVGTFAQPRDNALTSTSYEQTSQKRETGKGRTRHAHKERSGGVAGGAGRERNEEYA